MVHQSEDLAAVSMQTHEDYRSVGDSSIEARDPRWRLGFWSLTLTQVQGAFNDNALKFLVIYILVDRGLPASQRDRLIPVVGAIFALPFIFFSMTGGYLADRFSKRSVTIATKWLEFAAIAFALLALARENFTLECVAVFLMSSLMALFGPSKYGLLPEILSEKDLSWGNGITELGIFMAAIAATVAAGFLAGYFRGQQQWSGVVLLSCTLLGLAASHGISRVPAANPARRYHANPIGDLWAHWRLIRGDRILQWAVIGNMYIFYLAALLQFTIVIYGHDILRIDDRHISYLQAAVAVGIGLGSLATGYLSAGKIEYGLIPLGSVGMTVFGFLSAMHGISLGRACLYLGLLGFSGGVYAVPLNALIQHRPAPSRKGGVIAAANLISWIGILLASVAYWALAEGRIGRYQFFTGLRADQIFFAGACMTLAATFYTVVLLPDSLVRLALWALTHTFYRVHVDGRDNIPERGGALFVAGRMTLLDAGLLAAATDRPVRFVMPPSEDTRSPLLERFLRVVHLEPQLIRSDRNQLGGLISGAFAAREVVCLCGVVGKGGIADDPLPRADALLREANAPVLAIAVMGSADGPIVTDGRAVRWKIPSRLPCHVTVRFGVPIAPPITPTPSPQMLGRLSQAAEGPTPQ